MNSFILKTRVGLFAGMLAFFVASCGNQQVSAKTTQAAPTAQISAPTSLLGTAIAFDVKKAELISGREDRLFQDGTLKSYFFNDRVFNDGREYNGFSWGSSYQYTKNGNQGEVVQKIESEDPSGKLNVTIKISTTYTAATSGTFDIDVQQTHSAAGSAHYKLSGDFHPTDVNLDMMAKGLPQSNMDLMLQNISANQQKFNLKAGSKISFNFVNPTLAKLTIDSKEYESKDYQLIPVDTFNKRIKGTITGNIPFEIKMNFDQFYFGKFDMSIGNSEFVANGMFMSSRWIPIAEHKVEGKFTDGLKFKSTFTKIEYPYSVYLPPHYATSGKKYPVFYLTDGQWVKEYYKAVEAHKKDFIVVAIEQGPENRRFEDFKLPGATSYIRFLKEEMIPHIEKQYRTTQKRFFWGASLGATLGEILLGQETADKPYFSVYALADGAYWANTPDVFGSVNSALAKPKSEKISVFTSGTREGNYIPNMLFVNRLNALNNPSLDVRNLEFKLTHTEMAAPTLEHYIDAIQ